MRAVLQSIMLLKLLVLFITLNSSLSFSQSAGTQPFALARKPKGIEAVPTQIRDRFERLGLQVVLKQKGYQILMSPEDIPTSSVVDIVAVESDVSKVGDRYQIETSLLDIKNKKLIRRARIKNVREEDLLRLYQASIEAVFKPKKETDEESEGKEKDPKEKVIPPPLTTKLNKANPNAIDFQKRIKSMKSDIEDQLKRMAKRKIPNEPGEDSENDQKKNPSPTSPSSSSSKTTNVAEVDIKKDPPKKFKGKSSYHVMAGMDKRVVDSQYLINTKTNTEMLTLKLLSHNTTRFFSERMAWSYDLSVSKLLSGKIDLPTLYQVGLYGTWLDDWGHFSMGVMRDKSFISNLNTPGEGLKISNLDTTWFLTKAELNLSFLANTKIHAAYGVPLLVSTQIDQLQEWKGSMYRVGIIPPRLVRNWDLNIILERISLTNQGVVPFTSEDSRIALLVQRSF